jgi:hypothetical protein
MARLQEAARELGRERAGVDSWQLNEGQLAAGVAILSGGDRFLNIQGVAGAGKSTLLGALDKVLGAEGVKLSASPSRTRWSPICAAAARACRPSRCARPGSRPGPSPVPQYLWLGGRCRHRRAIRGGQAALANTVIITDESSMVSSRDMLRLTDDRRATRHRQGAVHGRPPAIVGDRAGQDVRGLAGRWPGDRADGREHPPEEFAAPARGRGAFERRPCRPRARSAGGARPGNRGRVRPRRPRRRTLAVARAREARGDRNLHRRARRPDPRSTHSSSGPAQGRDAERRWRRAPRSRAPTPPARNCALPRPTGWARCSRRGWMCARSASSAANIRRVSEVRKDGKVTLERDGKSARLSIPTGSIPTTASTGSGSMTEKHIRLHDGETVFWRDKDAIRDIAKSTYATVLEARPEGSGRTCRQAAAHPAPGDPCCGGSISAMRSTPTWRRA